MPNASLSTKTNPTKHTIQPEKLEGLETKLILALDFGVKKMGMAMGNTLTQNARPFDIMTMNNGQPDWDKLIGIIEEWQIKQVVVGLPLNMDGSDSLLAKRASKFSRRLAHRLMEGKSHMKNRSGNAVIEVVMHDERLSSFEAREIAWINGWIKNERDPIDDISACLLLNSYLRG